ncbi:hypothetical protein EMIT0P100_160110 [Pseudomonas sp. IT-P100]
MLTSRSPDDAAGTLTRAEANPWHHTLVKSFRQSVPGTRLIFSAQMAFECVEIESFDRGGGVRFLSAQSSLRH